MRRSVWLVIAAAACGGDDGPPRPPGPYDTIVAAQTLELAGLTGSVDVVRDRYGIPHVYAASEADAYLADGYVVASDRWLQLELLRHVAAGRIAELFGADDPSQIDHDLALRLHRFRTRADAEVAALRADPSADARATVIALDRFAAGVNAWLDRLRAGAVTIDPAQAAFVAPATIEPWTAADSVAIGLLQAWSRSYDDIDLTLTAARQAGEAAFAQSSDPDRRARARAFDDLYPLTQLDAVSTIDGWPDGGISTKPGRAAAAPAVPAALLDRARAITGPIAVYGLALHQPDDGSNAWVIGPALAGGATLLANDPHLALSSPAAFHYVHLTVPDALDVAGVGLVGVPGVVLGHSATLAWGATSAYHDVLDFFLEDVHPCPTGGGDCVGYRGDEVRLETFDETIRIGTGGAIVDQFVATYEVVPHHGPILPAIVDHRLAPRAPGPAIAARYAGDQPTRETLVLARLDRAATLAAGLTALAGVDHGAQSWVLADADGHIGWTTASRVPIRSSGCRTWSPVSGQGTAPWFVLPGDGSCAWDGEVSTRDLPHAIDPGQGYLVTANADPVGETFDGDPLDGPHYAGFDYGPGFRAGRITRRLEAIERAGRPMTIDDMIAIQGDTTSSVGERLRPFVDAAATALLAERATPGAAPDLAAIAATLDDAGVARLTDARDRLRAWSLATPIDGDDAIATTIFNCWQIAFYRRAFGDALALLGDPPRRAFTIPAAIVALEHPERLRTGTAPDHPDSALLCDTLDTAPIETCTAQVAAALLDALDEASARLGPDPTGWGWGALHVATAPALVPSAALDLGGYPRPGDSHAVDAADPSIATYDFGYQHGPAMRSVIALTPGLPPEQRFALPGGEIFDLRSPHFRDLMDAQWSRNQYVTVPFTIPDILSTAEERWVLRPGG